jgi:hypothetical protein
MNEPRSRPYGYAQAPLRFAFLTELHSSSAGGQEVFFQELFHTLYAGFPRPVKSNFAVSEAVAAGIGIAASQGVLGVLAIEPLSQAAVLGMPSRAS